MEGLCALDGGSWVGSDAGAAWRTPGWSWWKERGGRSWAHVDGEGPGGRDRGTGPAWMEGAGAAVLPMGPRAPGLRASGRRPTAAPPPTWARPVVVEAAVPGEAAGLVAEASSVDPVEPPAAGEAGGVPAGAAAPRLGAAGQGPGPQPRQRAQRQPQGPHGQRSGRGPRSKCRPPSAAAPAAPAAGDAHPPGPAPRGPRPPHRPSPRGGGRGSGPRCGVSSRVPRDGLAAPAPARGERLGARGEAGARDPRGPAARPTSPGPELGFPTWGRGSAARSLSWQGTQCAPGAASGSGQRARGTLTWPRDARAVLTPGRRPLRPQRPSKSRSDQRSILPRCSV